MRLRLSRRFLLLAGISVIACVPVLAQQVGRDARVVPTTGTASIAGTVVIDDPDGPPVRRALVSISLRTNVVSSTHQTTTDEQGRFVFRNLPAGTYGPPTASKPGFVSSSYGETRPGGVGTPLSLAEGQKVTIAFKLLRGAVITGTLHDNGRPVIQTSVSATPVRVVNGVRVPGTSRYNSAQTDDRGVYRMYGLAPGDYIVAASPRLATNTEVRPVTEAELQWATQQLQPGQAASATAASGASFGATADPPPQAQPLGYSPVYYPGTSDPKAATTVTVAAGQERGGIDFSVAYVATARIEGVVLDRDGAPATAVQMNLIPIVDVQDSFLSSSPLLMDTMMLLSRPTFSNGRFSMNGVRPGKYTVFARGPAPGASPAGGPGREGGPGGSPLTMWATADVEVGGQDISGLELRLQPGLTISGRAVFDPESGPPTTDLSRLAVRLSPAPTAGVTVAVNLPVATPTADGSFRIEGVAPGRYLINASLPGGSPPWTLRSARVGDVDAADNGFELRAGQDTSGVVLTFTTRVAELSGRLLDGAGRPSSALSIFLFSVDPEHWSQRTRRIRPPVRAGTDGTFRFTNLLPGEYHLAALSDYEQADLFRPEFLEEVAAASMKITIGDGEKKVQDIRIAGGK